MLRRYKSGIRQIVQQHRSRSLVDSMERNLQDKVGPKKLGSHKDWMHTVSLAEVHKGQTSCFEGILILYSPLYGKLEGPHAQLPIAPHRPGPDLQRGFYQSVHCRAGDQVPRHDPKGSTHIHNSNKRQQMCIHRPQEGEYFKGVQQPQPKCKDRVYPFNAVTLVQRSEVPYDS